jgi:mono/diheme cytochrome c family protein
MKANKLIVPAIFALLALAVVAVSLMVHFQSLEAPVVSPVPSSQATSPGEVFAQVSGVSLYAQYCESCHGPLATSTKRGRTAAQIQTAISTLPGMESVKNLTSVQVQAIAAALATP